MFMHNFQCLLDKPELVKDFKFRFLFSEADYLFHLSIGMLYCK